jgi:Putative Actinobacterial Holin-X, holin superfamily III
MTAPTPVAPRRTVSVDVSERSFGELIGEVTQDLSTLMRQELELAKAELSEQAVQAGKAGGLFSGAAVAGHMVLLFVSIAAWWGLSNVMDGGWAALIVAAVWAVVAAVLFVSARSRWSQVRGLTRTVETVKEIPGAIRPDGGPNR